MKSHPIQQQLAEFFKFTPGGWRLSQPCHPNFPIATLLPRLALQKSECKHLDHSPSQYWNRVKVGLPVAHDAQIEAQATSGIDVKQKVETLRKEKVGLRRWLTQQLRPVTEAKPSSHRGLVHVRQFISGFGTVLHQRGTAPEMS